MKRLFIINCEAMKIFLIVLVICFSIILLFALLVFYVIFKFCGCPHCGKSTRQIYVGVEDGNDKETVICKHCGNHYFIFD